ncbi:MAG: hypothetical protein KF884_01505 [Fimbriimonadaceae bacterium]|nr:hypothetical protein [Fimbriimonadaceae bacterium]QYK58771.1 MAG: hypothetical protein KF884_01505 [Fimbriimonadaceae bacterium]
MASQNEAESEVEIESRVARSLWLTNGLIGFRVSEAGGPIGPAFTAEDWEEEGTDRLRRRPHPLASVPIINGKTLAWPLAEARLDPDGLSLAWPEKPAGAAQVSRTLEIRPQSMRVLERFLVRSKTPPKIETDPVAAGTEWEVDRENDLTTVVGNHSLGIDVVADASRPVLPTIKIDGPSEDQSAVETMLRYLALSHEPSLKMPPGPFGLSNDKYGGRVFWDSDAWMFPALLFLAPERARIVPRYRLEKLEAARIEYQLWAEKTGLIPILGAAKFPWEGGRDGRENAPAESERQHHISATVLFWLRQAAAQGLVDRLALKEAEESVGKFLAQRAEQRPDGQWTLKDVMSPDEFATVDDDLYTNVATEAALGPKWRGKFYRPRDATTFLSYTGDRLKGHKQAAALLAVWPLQDRRAEQEATKMLARFKGSTTPNGPAMTLCLQALVEARYDDPETAYQTWKESWKKYTHGPHLQFSEAPNGRSTYFLTGAGGCLNAVLYGFLGVRVDSKPQGGASWSLQTRTGEWVSVRPRLPRAWKSVTVDPFVVDGKRFVLTATADRTRLEPKLPGNLLRN